MIFLKDTFAGWGLFLLVGDVGLGSGGAAKEPSKSVEYMDVNLSLLAFELGRAGNTFEDAVCFPRMTFADLALSRASFTSASLSASIAIVSGPGGISLALAERDRGLSRVLGRRVNSAMISPSSLRWECAAHHGHFSQMAMYAISGAHDMK